MSSLDGMEVEANAELSETKRKSRNKSEKKRRDAFNKLITELHTMVTSGERKLDKSNVLKQTIAYLKIHNQTNRTGPDSQSPDRWKPMFLTNPEYCCLMMEGSGAFVTVISSTGMIMFASEGLKDILQVKNTVKGLSIFDFLDNNSGSELQTFLSAEVLRAASQNQGSESKSIRTLNLQMRRKSMSDEDCFVPVKLAGRFKRVAFSAEEMYELAGKGVAVCPTSETSCFVCVGRPTAGVCAVNTTFSSASTNSSDKLEFTATYNMEWKFIGLDQKALGVIGYLPLEVMGNSGYDYCHPDDLNVLVADHKLLMEKGKSTSCPYRFLTKGQQWIWLQTRSFITYHQWNSKPEFIVAVSWLVPDDETEKRVGSGDGAVSSSSVLAGGQKIKSEPILKHGCEKDGGAKNVLRPQPGVSIEHSPITPVSPRPGRPRRSGSSPADTPAEFQNSTQDSERICEELQARQSVLQQQILLQQQELRTLQDQLLISHPVDPPQPLLAAPAVMGLPVGFTASYCPCVRAQSPAVPLENCHWQPRNQ